MVQYVGHGHKLIDQRPSIPSPWERARPVPGPEVYSEALQTRFGAEQAQNYLNMTGRASIKSRFLEDFASFGYRDDNQIFERIQHSLATIPEMQWVDFSKGLGTDRESVGADGVITGAVSDETGIRGAYQY